MCSSSQLSIWVPLFRFSCTLQQRIAMYHSHCLESDSTSAWFSHWRNHSCETLGHKRRKLEGPLAVPGAIPKLPPVTGTLPFPRKANLKYTCKRGFQQTDWHLGKARLHSGDCPSQFYQSSRLVFQNLHCVTNGICLNMPTQCIHLYSFCQHSAWMAPRKHPPGTGLCCRPTHKSCQPLA